MTGITRRGFLKTAAAASGAVLGLPGLRRPARAQTTLRLALRDSGIPGANDALQHILAEWGTANHVQVQADFNINPTAVAAAEARGGIGHDIVHLHNFASLLYKEKLEPLDDVAAGILKQYGNFRHQARELSYHDGTWTSLPLAFGSFSHAMVTRIDYWQQHAGLDVTELFPAEASKRQAQKVAAFTYDALLAACKRLAVAGHMFGMASSACGDANRELWALLTAFGSTPVTNTGDIAIESDATLAGIECVVELSQSMPQDIYRWTDSSNNRWIISGDGSGTLDPPSTWAVARRDQPAVAAQLWYHDVPAGPHGRFRGATFVSYGVWRFSPHKQAARDLLTHVLQKEQQWTLLAAGQGAHLPASQAFYAHPVWTEAGPPPGGLYNYVPRGDERLILTGWPAPPGIAARIEGRFLIPTMMAKAATGKLTPKEAMQWAARELEDYARG